MGQGALYLMEYSQESEQGIFTLLWNTFYD